MLSGLVFCMLCGKTMGSMTASKAGPRSFFCSTVATGGCGKTRIAMDPLEQWVRVGFVEALSDVTLSSVPGDGPQDMGAATRQAIMADERALEQMDADYYDGILDRSGWLRQRRRMSDRLEANQAQLSRHAARLTRAHLPAPAEILRVWDGRDNAWKRSMLSALIERVEIDAVPSGMAFTLPRRRRESDAQLAQRRAEHLAAVLVKRVTIVWRA
jgi:hypothetical protein